jgi:ABC-type spermidine/putrescine transport system permease subunit II
MLVIVPMSFGESSFLEFPPKGFSLRWYETFFSSLPWTSASLRSLQVGLLSAALATVLGTLAAFALVRGRLPGKTAINAFILSPMIIPRMVIAIAVYFLYARLNLVGTAEGLVLAHVVLGVPFVVVTVSAVLKGFDLTLEHAAQTLGANRWQTFRHVTLPLIQAGVLSGALFAFITSFDELIIALFVTGGIVSTLPKKMWDDILLQVNPTLAAVSTVLLILTTALLLTAELLRRRAERLKGAAPTA